MTATPFMQLYVADYLGDTLHLTTEQHGAYLLLLMAMWRAGGRLPNDEQKLARIVGLSAARWRRVSGDVLAFFEVEGGSIAQKRLTKEIKKTKEKSAKRADAGSKGGAAKALKYKETGLANATDLPKHSSETRDQIPEEDKKDNAAKAASVTRAEAEFEVWYVGYPHKVGRAAALKAFAAARRKADLRTLVDGRDRYVRTKPPDRPWCNPATWLNQERWNDEPSADDTRNRTPSGHHHREPRGFDAVLAGMARVAHQRGLTEPGGDAGMEPPAGDPGVIDADLWPADGDRGEVRAVGAHGGRRP